MSVDLQLNDNSLSLEQWQELCETWSRQQDVRLFGEARFQDGERPRLYVSGPGSIRGFLVELDGGDIAVHIPAMASTDDWRRCYSLLRWAVREGGGSVRLEEGQIYGAEELSPDNADRDAEGNIMLPFYGPEITPRRDFEAPEGLLLERDERGRPRRASRRTPARCKRSSRARRAGTDLPAGRTSSIAAARSARTSARATAAGKAVTRQIQIKEQRTASSNLFCRLRIIPRL